MMTIYKYILHVDDSIVAQTPKGAKPLSVQVQRGAPCVWALVDNEAPLVPHKFALRGTGHPCDGLSLVPFVGTFQLHGGQFVGHLFDLGEG